LAGGGGDPAAVPGSLRGWRRSGRGRGPGLRRAAAVLVLTRVLAGGAGFVPGPPRGDGGPHLPRARLLLRRGRPVVDDRVRRVQENLLQLRIAQDSLVTRDGVRVVRVLAGAVAVVAGDVLHGALGLRVLRHLLAGLRDPGLDDGGD